MSKQYDRDAKIAYVEQIRAGVNMIEAPRELGLHKSTIYIYKKATQKMGNTLFQEVGT